MIKYLFAFLLFPSLAFAQLIGNEGLGNNVNLNIGSSVVSGGTTNQLLYDNGGVLGEVTKGNSCVYLTSGAGAPSCGTTIPAVTLTTPIIGIATGTSLALNGASIGSNVLAITGTAAFSGLLTGPGLVTTSAAPTVSSGQIGYGSTTAAVSNCGALATACIVVNVAGTARYIPYY